MIDETTQNSELTEQQKNIIIQELKNCKFDFEEVIKIREKYKISKSAMSVLIMNYYMNKINEENN